MPSKNNLEKQLSKIEAAVRQEQAPKLFSDYGLGFQILEADEDEKKAVGVRAFKIGPDLTLYAPFFFENGEGKGEELLMVKEKDIFVPFTDDWKNFLLSKEPLDIGKPDEPIEGDGLKVPDILSTGDENLKGMGSISKQSSVGFVKQLENIAENNLPLVKDKLENEKSASFSIDFKPILKNANNKEKEALTDLMLNDDSIAEYFANKIEDIDLLKPASEPIITHITGMGSYNKYASENEVEVIIHTRDDFSEEEKAQYRTDKYIVRDNRSSEKTAETIDLSNIKVSTPGNSGIYKVLMKDNEIKDLLLIKKERPEDNYLTEEEKRKDASKYTIIDLDTKRYKEGVKSGDILVSNDGTESDGSRWNKFYNDINDDDTFKSGSMVVFVGPKKGEVFGPVEIKDRTTNTKKQIEFTFYNDFRNGKGLITQSNGELIVNKKEEMSPSGVEKQVVIPSQYKSLILNRRSKNRPQTPQPAPKDPADEEGNELKAPHPMSKIRFEDLLDNMGKKLQVKSKDSGGYLVINDDKNAEYKNTYKEALKSLIEEHKLSEKEANHVLKQASDNGSSFRIVKESGMPPMPMGGPGMAGGPPMGPGPAGPGGPAPGPPAGPAPNPGMPYPTNPEAQKALELAQKAMAQGQTDVLDTAGLSTMLNASDSQDFMKRYMRDLMTALDRLGRILFTIYWKYDELKEDYGSDQLVELEDKLKNLFKQLGDVILVLKEGTPKGTELPISL